MRNFHTVTVFTTWTMRHRRRILVVVAGATVLLLALGVGLLEESAAPRTPVITTKPATIQLPPTPWRDRIPRSWRWAWWLRDKVFPRKVITVNPRVFKLDGVAQDFQANLPSAMPGPWESDGMGLWLFGEVEKAQYLELLDAPGVTVISASAVTTGDHIQARMSVGDMSIVPSNGPVFAGTDLSIYPKIPSAGTDLTVAITVTEAITNSQPGVRPLLAGSSDEAAVRVAAEPALDVVSLRTNLTLGLRAMVPKQGGLLLLKRSPIETEDPSYGLLISVDVPAHKR